MKRRGTITQRLMRRRAELENRKRLGGQRQLERREPRGQSSDGAMLPGLMAALLAPMTRYRLGVR